MYPINSIHTMFFKRMYVFFSPSQRQLTLVKNWGRHFRASVVENHQGPVAHWDVGNPAAPVSPKGDDQRRAFLTFTEVWGPGEFEEGVVFLRKFCVFDVVYEGLLMGLEFFCWCLRCSLSFFGWGLLGVLWEVLLVGLFWDVLGLLSFFCHVHCMYTLATDTYHFWATSLGEGKMVVLDAWYPNHFLSWRRCPSLAMPPFPPRAGQTFVPCTGKIEPSRSSEAFLPGGTVMGTKNGQVT